MMRSLKSVSKAVLGLLIAACGAESQIVPPDDFQVTLDRIYAGGPGGGEFFGYSVAGLTTVGGGEDFNGDLFMDYVVSSPFWSVDTGLNEITHTGKIIIYFGGPDGLSTTLPPIEIVNPPDVGQIQPQEGALFGFSVSGAFDVDHLFEDGQIDEETISSRPFADIIVGVPGADIVMPSGEIRPRAGRAWIIPGRADMSDVADPRPANPAHAWIELTALGATVFGTTITVEPQANARFGHSVSYIGNDSGGFDDVVVGAPFTDLGTPQAPILDAGAAFVFGAQMGPAMTFNAMGGVASNGLMFTAPIPAANALFGFSVSGAGLFDPAPAPGSGLEDAFDIAIGEPGFDANRGRAHVLARTLVSGSGVLNYNAYFCTVAGPSLGSLFGFCVTDIGQFDAEIVGFLGRDDIAIGAPGANNFDGQVFAFAGGTPCTTPLFPAPLSGDTGTMSAFGWSVSGGMNVGGSLIVSDELLVGAPFLDLRRGAAYLFLGAETTLGIVDDVRDCTILGPSEGSHFGWAVSEAYDVTDAGTGVGDEEFLVGAPRHAEQGNTNGGYARLVDWNDATEECITLQEFTGIAFGERRGFFVSFGADWNDDGVPELIAGAPFFDFVTPGFDPMNPESGLVVPNSGRLYILDGMTASVFAILEPNDPGPGSLFGFSAAVGNFVGGNHPVTGNPLMDIWVGAPFRDATGASDGGAIYLFDGTLIRTLFPGQILTSSERVFVGGDRDNLGYSIANAGILDADVQFDDIVAGAPRVSDLATSNPRIGLFNGAFLPAAVSQFATVVAAQEPYSRFGLSVGRVGHLEPGSTREEFAIGAPYAAHPVTTVQSGVVYVYSGEPNPVDGSYQVVATISRGQDGAHFGWSLAGPGDIDADGRPDLVVGAPSDNSDRGRVRIVSPWLNSDIRTYSGTQAGSEFGFSVSDTGTIDADLRRDIIIGAPKMDDTATGRINVGQVFLYKSTGTQLLRASIWGENAGDRFGFSVSRAGLFLADTTEDFIMGAPLAEVVLAADVILNSAGKVYLYDGNRQFSP